MANPNDFDGQSADASDTYTSRMRRINAIEDHDLFEYNRKWGSFGSGNGEFNQPEGIIVYDGEVFVAERNNSRVQVFDLNGTYLRQWGTPGSGDGEFSGLRAIAESSGEIYTTELGAGNARIQVFNTSGVFQRKWGSLGSGDGEFGNINGIDTYNEEIYVTDTGFGIPPRIQVFNESGIFQRKWGTSGTGEGEFITPFAVHIFSNEVYVSDNGVGVARIQVFSTAGIFDREFGTFGSGQSDLNEPSGIASVLGNLYITCRSLNAVKAFEPDGTYLYQFGTFGSGDGQMTQPWAIFGYLDEIYLTEVSSNERVQAFSIFAETEFFGYQNGAAPESLGTPDSGVSVPALHALAPEPATGAVFEDGADFLPEHNLIDMRAAIEALAPFYINADTGEPFDWDDLSENNLYFKAMGNRTKYGATGGAAYDWTRDLTELRNDQPPYDIDIGEIEETIALLEASALV